MTSTSMGSRPKCGRKCRICGTSKGMLKAKSRFLPSCTRFIDLVLAVTVWHVTCL